MMDVGNKVLQKDLQIVIILKFIRYLIVQMYFRWLESRNRTLRQIKQHDPTVGNKNVRIFSLSPLRRITIFGRMDLCSIATQPLSEVNFCK
jgi:hypothetical protein